MVRPEIIIKTYNPDTKALKEMLAGIEEEGVLYKVIHEQMPKDQMTLGYIASQMSQLEVGIGIQADHAALYVKKIKDAPLFHTTAKHRKLGQNAARYVKGNPLIEI
ncbi:glycerol dehydratase reactivase beta/small subunit family protein [Cellulosilyticum sp. I15G10I2]|uniref:glycerol dehydratase reactivase beta/small subunit family protein n=1 Tax=Cellulosilyticum sp. I15G10I2 TaxID=1892843 RepID=UPI00085C0579|nr:glycerol dehydratase reactivase beta/small subunit family protein [Cellulosilyticum sp. I15G10I2]